MPRKDETAVREALRRQIAEATAVLAQMDAPPTDPYEDGDVIQWQRCFSSDAGYQRRSPTVYTYVAIRINGYWYSTEMKRTTYLRWTTLWEDHLRHAHKGSIWRVTEWTEQEDDE